MKTMIILLLILIYSGCSLKRADQITGWLFHDYQAQWEHEDLKSACCCDR
jgi:hypothetical protein